MSVTNCLPTRPPPLWPYLLLCAGVAWFVSLGSFHQGHHADTLVPVLVSLQHWTPFFWDQDRIGMLVPLLALPFRNPLVNLLIQEALNIFAALGAMFLLAQYMLRDDSFPLAGMLSAVAFLALAPAAWVFDFTAGTFYGVWLALGLGGLVLLEAADATARWRWLVALALLVLAHWVYSATALLLGPLVLARFLLFRQQDDGRAPPLEGVPNRSRLRLAWMWIRRAMATEVGRQLLLLGLAFSLGLLFLRLAAAGTPNHTNLHSLPISQWPETWRQLLNNGWTLLTPHHWPYFLFGAMVVGLLHVRLRAGSQAAGVAWRAAVALGIAATLSFLLMGTRCWVSLNSCNARYIYPCFFLLQGALAMMAAVPASGKPSVRHPFVLAAVGLLLAALSSYHLPSIKTVRGDVDRTLGTHTADILAARCSHVAGDYWKVWPAVFHANLALHEQGENRTVWGISLCSGPTRAQWQHLPLEEVRIAVAVDDLEKAQTWLKSSHFSPSVVVERRATIYVLRPAAVIRQEPQQPVKSPTARKAKVG